MSRYDFDYTSHLEQLLPLLRQLESVALENLTPKLVSQIVRQHKRADGQLFAKDQIIVGYKNVAGTQGLGEYQEEFIKRLQMKPVRTSSGVTPITVLTKPFPCPGKCIFCPNDIRMPKSYLSDEPGAQRAERNFFDPYLQTYNRLQALDNIGHTIDKAELIILGGTWSYYPEPYQIWFIKECFRALNEFGVTDSRPAIYQRYDEIEQKLKDLAAHVPSNDPSINKANLHAQELQGVTLAETYNQVVSKVYVGPERKAGLDAYQSANWEELETQQKNNETATVRSVGLVIETRPDNISPEEVIRVRRLGCTKTQIGVQSLQDEVLEKNKRGHGVAATRRAFKLLRQAGFKIHAHWMANLYGSSVELDKQDYLKLFDDKDFRPDELKIYPCSLINSAELMQYYKDGRWQPYTHEELLDVLTFALMKTPEYCRLTRVIRDIPSTDIVVGNKKTNFRQIAEQELEKAGQRSSDIRSREIRRETFAIDEVELDEVWYESSISREVFLQYVIKNKDADSRKNKIVAFLRLSLPSEPSFIDELKESAIIREVHVYGQAVSVGQKGSQRPQHLGLGTKLIERAKSIASGHGFKNLAVISAIGTREYYRKKGFSDGQLYQSLTLS